MSSEADFRALYESHYPEVHAFCVRRVGRAAADDVTSEVFTTAWRRMGRLESGSERAWLFGIARNVIRNQWRSEGRHRRLIDRIPHPGRTSMEIPEDLIVGREEQAIVVDALRTLGRRDQEILILSAWDDLSGHEIADVLRVAPNTVHQRLYRAKERLARAIESIADSDSIASIAKGGAT